MRGMRSGKASALARGIAGTVSALVGASMVLGVPFGSAAAETSKPLPKIRLVSLNTIPGFLIWGAKELGYFKEEGVDVVSLKFYPNGPAEIASGYAGAWDAGYMGGPPSINAGSKFGLLIGGILDWQRTNYSAFIRKGATKGQSLTEYLKGKTALTITASNLQFFLDACLRHHNVDPSTVKMINMTPPNIYTAARGGEGDIISDWGQFALYLSNNDKFEAICDSNKQVGIQTFDAYVIHPKYAKEHPDGASAFIRAVYRVNDKLTNDQQSMMPLIKKYLAEIGSKLPEKDIKPMIDVQSYPSPEESLELINSGQVKGALEQSAKFLASIGAIESVPKIDFITTKFIEDAIKHRKK